MAQLSLQVWNNMNTANVESVLSCDRTCTSETRRSCPPAHHRYTGHTLAKFVVTFLTGILTGFFAVAMTSLTGLIIEYKLQVVELTMDQEGSMGKRLVTAFFWFWLFGSALVSVAVAMVRFFDCSRRQGHPYLSLECLHDSLYNRYAPNRDPDTSSHTKREPSSTTHATLQALISSC